MRNGRVSAKPIGGRIALSTKQSKSYRANTRKPRKKPKGIELVRDQPIVFDLRIAQDVQAIEDFGVIDLLEQMSPPKVSRVTGKMEYSSPDDEYIYLLPLAKLGFVATTCLAIMEAVA